MIAPNSLGRIRDHSPDWRCVTLELGNAGPDLGDTDRVARFKWHPETEFRSGQAIVFARIGDQLWFRQPLLETVPAACDMDYVFLVEE